MPTPLVLSVVHHVVCIFGAFANFILLILILHRTPTLMRSYAILVFSQTVAQLMICFTSGILFIRLIPQGETVFLVTSGIGKVFCSHKATFYLYSIMLHGFAHYSIMLAACFCFRYYVILNPKPNKRMTILCLVILYMPTFIIFILFSQSTLYDSQTAKGMLASRGADYIFDDGEVVTGIVSVIGEASAFAGMVWVCGIGVPVYVVIIVASRKMTRALASKEVHMSEKTRQSHLEIRKGLLIQSCLPSVYVIACVFFAAGQLQLVKIMLLEYIMHMIGEFMVSISAVLTLYYVKPYRRALMRCRPLKSSVQRISKQEGK